MDYSTQNNIEREFYKKDFSPIKELILRIREAFVTSKNLSTAGLNLAGIINFRTGITQTYITLFQEGLKPLRWGACRSNLETSLNRDIEKIKSRPAYNKFDISDSNKCRIMIEYVTEEIPAKLSEIRYATFVPERFEPGVTGIKLKLKGETVYYMPTDAWVYSQIQLRDAFNTLLKKTYIKDMTNKISERFQILANTEHECSVIKSHAFISYKDDVLPLYRGNLLYDYSVESLKDVALKGADWIVKYQTEDGRYLYYYDAKEDNYIDHEHPTRTEDDLYYNDLRHCGGIVTLIKAYQLTKDKKYLESAKKGIDFITTITSEHEYNGKPAAFVYYNKKGKLGGTGMILIAMMKYRNVTGDKSYDEYIKKYARHLISRVYKTGEFMGYYIHPSFQNGESLINMSDNERRQTFSFYYPGESLLGLALFANYFDGDDELKNEVLKTSELALDWIVQERPKIYSDMFATLPSDAWLMQAIEEWASNPHFRKQIYFDFVFRDSQTMMNLMYKKDDSPFIDYEGSFYYNYGDHFYPDGSRSEGLIAGYYLAKKLGDEDKAAQILEGCRLVAKSQLLLANNEYNNYAHKNPEKSKGSIRFKATRQWVRVDSIQHVACFFFRLYFAETGLDVS